MTTTTTIKDIKVGSKVIVTAGFAKGEIGDVEATHPHSPSGPYAMVLLPFYGLRRFPLEYLTPATAPSTTTLADLAARIITHTHGITPAVIALREQHGGNLPTADYLAAIKTAIADREDAAVTAQIAANRKAQADLAELADIAAECYPTSLARAAAALRDAARAAGCDRPGVSYILTARDARNRRVNALRHAA